MGIQGIASLGGGSTRSVSTMRSASPSAPPPQCNVGSFSNRCTSLGNLVWSPPDWEAGSPRQPSGKKHAGSVFVSPRFDAGRSPVEQTPSWRPSQFQQNSSVPRVLAKPYTGAVAGATDEQLG